MNNFEQHTLIAPFNEMDQPLTEDKIKELDAVLPHCETDPSFIDMCLAGEAYAEDIDNFVDLWYSSEAGHGKTLREYLGFTIEEYVAWIKDADALIDILQDRTERDQIIADCAVIVAELIDKLEGI